jgi:hypothetical protein
MWVYYIVIWNILWPLGNVVVICYLFPHIGVLCQEKSGNPDPELKHKIFQRNFDFLIETRTKAALAFSLSFFCKSRGTGGKMVGSNPVRPNRVTG